MSSGSTKTPRLASTAPFGPPWRAIQQSRCRESSRTTLPAARIHLRVARVGTSGSPGLTPCRSVQVAARSDADGGTVCNERPARGPRYTVQSTRQLNHAGQGRGSRLSFGRQPASRSTANRVSRASSRRSDQPPSGTVNRLCRRRTLRLTRARCDLRRFFRIRRICCSASRSNGVTGEPSDFTLHRQPGIAEA